MSSINTANYLPERLAQAIANPLFAQLDALLRGGRHICAEDLENHAYLLDFYPELERFYQRYQVELIKAPEGFFYLRPKSNSLISRSVLSELDMLIGKVVCYLYLSPQRLANEGIFSLAELNEELLNLVEEGALLKFVNQRSSGTDLDRKRLFDKVRASLKRLARLGMVVLLPGSQANSQLFTINESVFRFGADVREEDEDQQAAQLRLIQQGEAMLLEEDAVADEQQDWQEDADGSQPQINGLNG